MSLPIGSVFPELDASLAHVPLASLPTPVRTAELVLGKTPRSIWIKSDDLSGKLYGGNKVRKLEFLFGRTMKRGRTRVATFGAAASNHALATAIYARELGLDCTCLLGHQSRSEKTRKAIRAHANLGTELVYYGGDYGARVATMRSSVQGRNCCVIPVGGSSWLGCIGFVNAAFELAEQVAANELPCPDVVYIATGTMGAAAGLALGLALAGLPTRVEAIRVTEERYANRAGLDRLIRKTALMMTIYGATIPERTVDAVRIDLRHEFLGKGYAKSNDATERAVSTAATQCSLQLETTYTGKAMAALLHDVAHERNRDRHVLFWNTYNSRPLPEFARAPVTPDQVATPFRRYLD